MEAFDPDPNDKLVFSSLYGLDHLPDWINLTPDGLLSGTAPEDWVGDVWLPVTVTDSAGVTVEAPFRLFVNNVNDAPEFINVVNHQTKDPIGNNVINEQDTLQITITGSDPDFFIQMNRIFSITMQDGNPAPDFCIFHSTVRLICCR